MSRLINTRKELDNITKADKGILVLFYASWCPFSRAFLPVFEKLAANNESRFCRVLTDALPGCEDEFSVDTVPTVLFFKNGKVSKRLDGTPGMGLEEDQLQNMIETCEGR